MSSQGDRFGQIVSGLNIAKGIHEKLVVEVNKLSTSVPNFKPGLAIVQVGGREDSNIYIRMKLKAASEIGINAQQIRLPTSTNQFQLLGTVRKLNKDSSIHGIIIQMPIDSENDIDSHFITDSVLPEKDVDGLHTMNIGKIAAGDFSGICPCTPNGVLELIKSTGVSISGKEAVVLGRSRIVGTPMAELLKWNHATVTVCHSRTKDIEQQVSKADILVVAIGQPEFVKGTWVKKGAVVIDCGINAIRDPSKKAGHRLVGDVAFEEVKSVAGFITPVPGGVGPMTVAMLMQNTVNAAKQFVLKLIGSDEQPTSSWPLAPLSLKLKYPVPSDIEISRDQEPKDISELAAEIGILPSELIPYGTTKAKLSLSIRDRLKKQPNGYYVVVSGITPTPLGEGKSTITVGLAQGLVTSKQKNAIACLRQPSQGPTFGIKGGAAGGGYSQVIPMEDFNLHLTGDIHAVVAANNLLAAQLEARMFHEATQTDKALFDRLVPVNKGVRAFSKCQIRRLLKVGIDNTNPDTLTENEIRRFCRLDIDPKTIIWERVIDTNDRFLRQITIGQSPTEKGHKRITSFSIAVASEVMAILALASDIPDLKKRLARIVVATDERGNPVTADDLGAVGAMAVLLKDAIQPTLMQSLEGTPVIVHTGPFANIAHGCSSVIADNIALKLVGPNGYTVTECGFGSEIGLEKLFNLKCRSSGLKPNCVVLVTTVRALKMHGGGPPVTTGQSLNEVYTKEHLELLEKGLPNLLRHISNAKKFGIPVVVAINAYATDSPKEWEMIKTTSIKNGADDAVISTNWIEGGVGTGKLADAVIKACQKESDLELLYDLDCALSEKVNTVSTEMYGAGTVEITYEALQKLLKLEGQGFRNLPICMAKTALSFTGDPNVKGAPDDFEIKITDAYLSAGAGFVVIKVGEISKMPGLPTRPCIFDIDLDVNTGKVEGLF